MYTVTYATVKIEFSLSHKMNKLLWIASWCVKCTSYLHSALSTATVCPAGTAVWHQKQMYMLWYNVSLRRLCWKGSTGRDAWILSLRSTRNGDVFTWNVLYMHWRMRTDCAWKRSASLKCETTFVIRCFWCSALVVHHKVKSCVSVECGCNHVDHRMQWYWHRRAGVKGGVRYSFFPQESGGGWRNDEACGWLFLDNVSFLYAFDSEGNSIHCFDSVGWVIGRTSVKTCAIYCQKFSSGTSGERKLRGTC